jgi:type IV pilus assembly protein PilV
MQMKSRGFSLIEVMAALIIISVGLLGIAKMQALALSSTGTARLRSLAAIEAASLAASMHIDRTYWGSVGPAKTVTVTGTTIPDSTLGVVQSCTGSGGTRPTPCTAARMAAEDLQLWAKSVQAVLPNDIATITCNQTGGAPVTCTIKIQWAEHIVNSNNQEATTATATAVTAASTTYTLSVEP